MRGDEKRVVDAFVRYLEGDGWKVAVEQGFCDVVASKNGETLYAEAKGRTTAIGLDVDTMFGQLLRRMKPVLKPGDSYAVVVPTEAATAVARVPSRVRDALRIRVFLVSPDGDVTPG
jgi:hypothetical protein